MLSMGLYWKVKYVYNEINIPTFNLMADRTPNNMAPTSSMIDGFFGRYELVSGSHNKFWECLFESGNASMGTTVLRWGRIGAQKPQSMRIPMSEVRYRAQKKLREGYKYIPGSLKTITDVDRAALYAGLSEQLNQPTAVTSRPRKM